jgi:hypothetical protein
MEPPKRWLPAFAEAANQLAKELSASVAIFASKRRARSLRIRRGIHRGSREELRRRNPLAEFIDLPQRAASI